MMEEFKVGLTILQNGHVQATTPMHDLGGYTGEGKDVHTAVESLKKALMYNDVISERGFVTVKVHEKEVMPHLGRAGTTFTIMAKGDDIQSSDIIKCGDVIFNILEEPRLWVDTYKDMWQIVDVRLVKYDSGEYVTREMVDNKRFTIK